MRAIPMLHSVPRRLPRPVVEKAVVRQPINLKPMGNTVAVSTLADNPFEGAPEVVIVTQASGGMARPDQHMQSRGLLHSYLPGIGADPVVTAPVAQQPAGVLDFLSTAATGASDILRAREQAKIAAAQAEAARASAAMADAQARRDAILATLARPAANMSKHKAITIPLLVIAGGALLTAGILFMRKRKAA